MPQGQDLPPEPDRPAVDVDVLRTLFLSPGDWIHRRVESVLMSPDGVTRRKVSLDVDRLTQVARPVGEDRERDRSTTGPDESDVGAHLSSRKRLMAQERGAH